MSVKIATLVYMSYRALKYITLNCIINYWSKLIKLKYMRHVFKKNYNLIIKNFVPMWLRREQYYSSHIAVSFTRNSRETVNRETALYLIQQNSVVPKRFNTKL